MIGYYCGSMKKDGFTLFELLSIVVILAILICVSLVIYRGISNNVLESQYKNLILDVVNKASEYVEKTGTTEPVDVSIDFLIKEGIITPDDENYLYDPRDRKNILNCYIIHVYLDKEEYVGVLGNKEVNNDGTCRKSTGVQTDLDILCNNKKCSGNWYNQDITLTITGLSKNDLLNSEIEWTNLNGIYEHQTSGQEKKLVVSPELVLNTTYNVLIKYDGKEKRLNKVIKIDKENPKLIESTLKVAYGEKQYLQVEATDMSGSGYKGFALSRSTCSDKVNYQSSNLEINSSGRFLLCIVDNAGNVYEKSLQINKVTFDYNDTSNTKPTKKDTYFIESDANYPLLVPTRNGYTFSYWEKDNKRVYSFDGLKDKDTVKAKWNFNDIDVAVDKIDKNSVGVMIENKVKMVLVLDRSGSMWGGRLESLKQVAKNLVYSMSFKAGSTISFVTFTGSAHVGLSLGRDQEEAFELISSIGAEGGTNFIAALDVTNRLIDEARTKDTGFTKDNTYMIFVSDGMDLNQGSVRDLASTIKEKTNTVFSIGIGSRVDTRKLIDIASPGCYFNSDDGLSSLQEIFTKIQEEIREEVTLRSTSGLIHLPNLFVSSEYPFVLEVNGKENNYNTLAQMNDLITEVNNVYYLDLTKVDDKFKLNGNLSSIKITYYYS